MKSFELKIEESVATLTMTSGENRFNPEFLDSLLGALDQVENETDAKTLVITSAHEKIFSNGIDLEWIIPVIHKNDMETAEAYFFKLNELFKRTITYPMVTIAAISGHAFGAGAIWSCAFDFRFMRSDRGFFCFPEIDLGIPFLPGMLALLRKAIPLYKMEEMIFTGSRLTAGECKKHHIVLDAYPKDRLLDETLSFAKSLNKKRDITREIKSRMYREVVRIIDEEDTPYIRARQFHIA